MRKINQAGLDLIKKWEGFRSNAYRDAVGIWTIGYGHTSMAGPPKVTPGLKITRAEGEAILARDLAKYEKGVLDAIGSAPVSDNEFAAMVSLCYNIGPGAFGRSRVARYVVEGRKLAAAAAFAAWHKAGGKVLQGLVNRRAGEADLFLTPDKKPDKGMTGGEAVTGGGVIVGGGIASWFAPEWAPVIFAGVLVGVVGVLAAMIIRKRKRK